MKKLNVKIPLLFVFLAIFSSLLTGGVFAAPMDAYYKDLQILDQSPNVTRKSYTATAGGFYKIYTSDPSGKDADEALLGAARSYRRSYERFKIREDIDKALRYYSMLQGAFASDAARNAYLETSDIFRTLKDPASAKFSLNRLINKYPDSSQAKTAGRILDSLNSSGPGTVVQMETGGSPNVTNIQNIDNVVRNNPPDNPPSARTVKASAPGEPVTVFGIRYFSDKDYTRVVIDISGKADYRSLWLKEDKGINRPPRLTIDVDGSVIVPDIPRQINIKDGLLSSVRLGYHAKDKRTRIVLDSENIKDFTVFQMSSPSRIVVDLFSSDRGGEKAPVVTASNKPSNSPVVKPQRKAGQKDNSGNTMNITDVLGLKIKTIVIDAGHGGKDPGAIYNNVKEKDIILDIAIKLRDMLKKDPNLTVYMTRDSDVFIPLEERTALANKYKADIFVSIHANAAKNTAASGVETYVFNVTNDRAALEVAALENNATTKATSDLSDILKDILKYSKLEDSLLLAGHVHQSVIKSASGSPKNLGVKQAPFYVLLGARMPSILIETGFITNKEEAGRLKSQNYRKQIASGIYDGLQTYIAKYNNK